MPDAGFPNLLITTEFVAFGKGAAEKFIVALKNNDHKTAYEVFYPEIRARYPFPVFVDIQKNVTKTVTVSYVGHNLTEEGYAEKLGEGEPGISFTIPNLSFQKRG